MEQQPPSPTPSTAPAPLDITNMGAAQTLTTPAPLDITSIGTAQGPTAPPSPVQYNFDNIENINSINPNVVNAFKQQASTANLSQEQAQSFLTTMVSSLNTSRDQSLTAQQTEWTNTILNHPVYGGNNFDSNRPIIKRGFDLLPEKTKVFLEEAGLTNHPDIWLMCYQSGRMMTPDNKFIQSQPTKSVKAMPDIFSGETPVGDWANFEAEGEAFAKKFYPKMNEGK